MEPRVVTESRSEVLGEGDGAEDKVRWLVRRAERVICGEWRVSWYARSSRQRQYISQLQKCVKLIRSGAIEHIPHAAQFRNTFSCALTFKAVGNVDRDGDERDEDQVAGSSANPLRFLRTCKNYISVYSTGLSNLDNQHRVHVFMSWSPGGREPSNGNSSETYLQLHTTYNHSHMTVCS